MRSMRNLPNESLKSADPFANAPFQHTDFLKAIIEQQKLVQQQEFEHKQKLQQEQQVEKRRNDFGFVTKSFISTNFQEQERKRQEMAYLKQLEMKKRQEEKLLILEQRKAEKNAQRERQIVTKQNFLFTFPQIKKISLQKEKFVEIVTAREAKRVTEDLQLRDLKVKSSKK